MIVWLVISIIVWETLIERLSKSLGSIIWVGEWWSSNGLWDSLDHHGDGNVVVVSNVLLLISVLLEDGVEGVITNNLSETLESDRLNGVKSVGWRDLQGDGFDLIDWDIEVLSLFVEVSLVLGSGLHKSGGFWWKDLLGKSLGGILGWLSEGSGGVLGWLSKGSGGVLGWLGLSKSLGGVLSWLGEGSGGVLDWLGEGSLVSWLLLSIRLRLVVVLVMMMLLVLFVLL